MFVADLFVSIYGFLSFCSILVSKTSHTELKKRPWGFGHTTRNGFLMAALRSWHSLNRDSASVWEVLDLHINCKCLTTKHRLYSHPPSLPSEPHPSLTSPVINGTSSSINPPLKQLLPNPSSLSLFVFLTSPCFPISSPYYPLSPLFLYWQRAFYSLFLVAGTADDLALPK